MPKLAINITGNELEKSVEYCRAENLGLEITAFAWPDNLNGNLPEIIERHQKATAGIKPLSSHGPFFELCASSLDPEIVKVCMKRHTAALDASAQVGASLYIAHTLFTPLIRDERYRKKWPGRMLDFWLPMADEAGKLGITICFENLWEPEPDIQTELIATANHPHLKASFDNGHALLFSEYSSAHWIETLGSLLVHCHLHDNAGELDDHKPIGEGIENWPELVSALNSYSSEAVLVAESDTLSDTKISIDKLRTMGF